MQRQMVTAPVLPWVSAAIAVTGVVHGYLFVRLIKDTALRGRTAFCLTLLLVVGALLLPAGMLGLLYMRVLPRVVAQPLMTTAFTYVGVLFFVLGLLLWLELQALVLGRITPRRSAAIALGGAAILSIGPAGGMASSIVSPSPTILGPTVRSKG